MRDMKAVCSNRQPIKSTQIDNATRSQWTAAPHKKALPSLHFARKRTMHERHCIVLRTLLYVITCAL